MSAESENALAERALIAATTRRDVEVTTTLLRGAGVECAALAGDPAALAGQLRAGVGAVVLTDAALDSARLDALLDALARQPPWSDVPVLLLTPAREQSPAAVRMAAVLTNLTLLDSPVSVASMVSAVLAALRARRRQYQVRDQWIEQCRAETALRDADRRKDEFIATLAHELRNPLAPIRTGLEALARMPAESAHAGRLREMMERQVGLLVKLIDDLLEVSRISTGKVALDRARVDLRTIVDAAIESSRPAIDAAGHELRVVVPDEPVRVLGDALRLSQVLGNLLGNAAKYTPACGSIAVTLDLENGDAVVRVADNGSGIPEGMLERVFDLFAQVDRTLDRAQGGLGIGLSLVRQLVTLHGGCVTAESPGLGRGSTFTVRLPAIGSEAGAAGTDRSSPGGIVAKRRMRLLVVDDNRDAADTLSILLAASGHELRTEYSGTAALAAAREFRPDVVFCDIGLPGLDGHAVASRLRDDRRLASTILVAVSGWGTEDDKRRARGAGFDFHVVKPVDVETLNEILARL